MRIELEDRCFEEAVLNGAGDIAVPIEITVSDTDSVITAYSAVREDAEKFASLFGSCIQSPEAMRWLFVNIAPTMREYGFYPATSANKWINEYMADSKGNLTPDSDGVVIIDDPTEAEAHLGNFDLCAAGADCLCAVKFADGKTVSAAYVDDTFLGSGIKEIGVDTLSDYRCRGYASECVAKLCRHLLTHGSSQVIYRTFSDNCASVKTAEKAGMHLKSRIFDLVCYKNSE